MSGSEAGCLLCTHILKAQLHDFTHLNAIEVGAIELMTSRGGSNDPIKACQSFELDSMAYQEANGKYISGITLTAKRVEGYTFLGSTDLYGVKQGSTSSSIEANNSATCSKVSNRLTWSQSTCVKARAWLTECDLEHDTCRQLSQLYMTCVKPQRLISLAHAYPESVRVIDTASLEPYPKYAALSHCWGGSQPCMLLVKDVNKYKEGILISTMPQTFQDAIEVCKGLNLKYLWIDSLCIIQDSVEDWSSEAAHMADVYSNSFINIAGTASKTSNAGLFRPLDPYLVHPIEVSMKGRWTKSVHWQLQQQKSHEHFVEKGPLNRRAWVLQERTLSRRSLHFALDQIHGQCPTQWATEFGNVTTLPRAQVDLPASTTNYMARVQNIVPDPVDRYMWWRDIVEAFTNCSLTYPSDRLIAISGLARRFSAGASIPDECEYLAGLWRGQLPRHLLWDCSTAPVLNQQYLAPSWSWASLNCGVYFYGDDYPVEQRIMLEILDIRTISAHDIMGAVDSGYLRARGHLCEIRRVPQKNSDPSTSQDWLEFDDSFHHYVYDYAGKKATIDYYCTLFFLPITWTDHEHLDNCYAGLVLQPTCNAKGQYFRTGMIDFQNIDDNKRLERLIATKKVADEHYLDFDDIDRYTIEII
jgi:Heterokaryon incompatibility protein (HET)